MSGDERREVLRRGLRAWLEDQEAFGIEDVPVPRASEPAGGGAAVEDAAAALAAIAEEVASCTRCGLHATRTKAVPGQGNPAAEILFVGEAPGADEDRSGLAFVGRAGQLLTKMIKAMGFEREEVFIANVLKCRPPGNRDPRPEEAAACLPFLKRQIRLIRPGVIVALGAHAARNLLGTSESVGRMRGREHVYEGIPLVVTYHPSYLLRSPGEKRKAWDDLKRALRVIGREPPPPR